MDFGSELFWVVLLILYLVFQVLGARKKQQHKKQRPELRRPQQESSAPDRQDDLDEALREIRRALGFPDERSAEPSEETKQPSEAGDWTTGADEAYAAPGAETSAPPEKPSPAPREAHIPSRPKTDTPAPAEARYPATTVDESRDRRMTVERPSTRKQLPGIPPAVPTTRTTRQPPERGRDATSRGIYSAEERAELLGGSSLEMLDRPTPEALSQTEVPPTSAGSHLPGVVEGLRDPASARQAFVMKEILDKPRAFRRLR